MPSLISLTWGCTSLMRSCSILDNFSMRLPCSRSWANRAFCLTESRCIHQKQTPQQTVPAKVIQKARLFSFIEENENCGAPLNNGQLHAALNDAGADGIAGEPGGVMDVELLHEMFAMLLDGLDADAEFDRRFLVGLAFGDELQHFHLARGQLGNLRVGRPDAAWQQRIKTIKMPGNRGAEKSLSRVNFPDGPAYIMRGSLFQQESHRAG